MLSTCINVVAFPLALVLVLYYTRDVVHALKNAAEGKQPTEKQLSDALRLAMRAAVIGGALWCLAAVLYPVLLKWLYPPLAFREFSHFFFSHVICGGVAAIYPFYGMTVYATTVLYPRLVRVSMSDEQFDRRVAQVSHRSEMFLLMACFVPFFSFLLLLFSNVTSRHVMLANVMVTAFGFIAAFYAYKRIVKDWELMGQVISKAGSGGSVPGAD